MRILWDILRSVWKYSKPQTSDKLLKLLNVGMLLLKKVSNVIWFYINLVEHESTQGKEVSEPFEGVADAIRRLGRKFLKYELIFNPPTLVPMVEKYNLETVQRDGWVPEAFLDAGIDPHAENPNFQVWRIKAFSQFTIISMWGRKLLGMKDRQDY